MQNGITTDITAPTMMHGNTTLSGYEKAIQLTAVFEGAGDLNMFLLLD
ncbi:hypothetical protein [Oceanobacillus damuensis]|nr:hypothetical protein [Oceanobacillus damuensis]